LKIKKTKTQFAKTDAREIKSAMNYFGFFMGALFGFIVGVFVGFLF